MSHPATSQRLLLFINPASGSGRGAGAGAEAVARFRSAGADVRVVGTAPQTGTVTGRMSAHGAVTHEDLTDALRTSIQRERPDAVVVVGGDGMVHAAVNVLAETEIPLGLVPAGTGNDFARNFGVDRLSVRMAAEQIITSLVTGPRRVDLARVELRPLPSPSTAAEETTVEVRWVASGVNLGFDAVVNARANALRWPTGRARYVVAVLQELWRYTAPALTVSTTDQQGTTEVGTERTFVLSVLNGSYFGGGMKAAPGASVDDGLIDTLWVPAMRPARFLQVFPRVFSGGHATVPEVRLAQVQTVEVAASDEESGGAATHTRGGRRAASLPIIHGDGEALGRLPVRITAVPDALRLLVGQEAR